MYRGRCLCGAIEFALTRRHLGAVNCYCSMCRRAHGTAFSTHVPMRRDQFVLERGELTAFASSTHGRREFCAACGSHVLVHGQTKDASVAVPAGLLDDIDKVEVQSHIFVEEKAAWQPIADELPQHVGWPAGVEATYIPS